EYNGFTGETCSSSLPSPLVGSFYPVSSVFLSFFDAADLISQQFWFPFSISYQENIFHT
ncbi:hypothetical protein ACTXT7_014251, partial [Hymenolepis weldensis]